MEHLPKLFKNKLKKPRANWLGAFLMTFRPVLGSDMQSCDQVQSAKAQEHRYGTYLELSNSEY